MNTSAQGLTFIKANEKFSANPQKNARGQWFIGYGHIFSATDLLPQTITEADAETYLAADIAAIDTSLSATLKTAVNQTQWDALADLYFSLGPDYIVTTSTPIFFIDGGKADLVPKAITDMNSQKPRANGRRTRVRRTREASLFATGQYSANVEPAPSAEA